jgi:hypothetical protein
LLISQVDVSLIIVVASIMLLGFWHLDQYPATWFDEGHHLQVAKNLTAGGPYAARSADGEIDYAPSIGVGPTVLFPVAASLELGGTSLTAARVVPVAYLIVATLLLYLVGRSLFSNVAGAATVMIAMTLPALDWVSTGRQVLGEVPAIAFLLLGGVLALRATTAYSLIAAGCVVGLAMVTKGQYLVILPPVLVILALVDYVGPRHRSVRWHATLLISAVGTYFVWLTTLIALMGDGHVVENVRLLRKSSAGALLVFDVDRMLNSLKLLLGPGSYLLVVPAAVAGLWAIRTASGNRQFALMGLWIFQAVWLVWYCFASIGWPRYAFAGLAVNTVFMGFVVSSVFANVRHWRIPTAKRLPLPAVAGAIFCVLLLPGAMRTLVPLTRSENRDVQAFVAELESITPESAVIDGWEPEVGFLTDRAIQYPPPGSLDRVVRAYWFGGEPMPDFSQQLQGEYLLIGPFSRWVGVYRYAAASPAYSRIAVEGPYELYERVQGLNVSHGR